jgi:uncharacterized protein (DUF1810 family)
MSGDDPYNLERFVEAHGGGVHERAAAELRAGAKRSHWMWFVFPQIAGLGYSETSRYYAISCLDEARAYLAHPILGPRVIEDAEILARLPGTPTANQIFGGTDAAKLCSSMTLFELAGGPGVFGDVLDRYYEAQRDDATLRLAS